MRIGRGSYGEIWLARSLTDAWRAVKIVDRRRFEDTRSFEREFDGMAKFEPLSREHEGFVDILHVGRSDDDSFFYYVMELADDAVQRPVFEPEIYEPKTLKSELKRVARLPADEAISLGLLLTTALAALHAHGLAHRDIKPANIIFCGGQPKIADIGLVSAMGQASFVGTEGYVPPEGPGTEQADIYSLGKVLYEIAMGRDRMEFPAINSALNELPDRALLLRLNDVLLRACAFDSAERYATADEMHDDLLRVRDGRPIVGRKSRRRWLPLAALLICGISALAWWKLKPVTGKGSAYIETDQPDVKVRIEGIERLIETPAKVADLPAGEHIAHILSSKYDAQDVKFTVSPNSETRVPKVALRRSVGDAIIESVPPGCEFDVLQDANVVKSGRAPETLTGLPTGEYQLLMRHEGREKRSDFTVSRGEPELVKIEFGSWKFSVSSVPAGAEIFADGKPVGPAPREVSLVEGEHKLTARYRTWPEQTLTVMAGPEQPLGVPFVFPTGSVRFSSAPTGAEVYLGEKRICVCEPSAVVEDVEPGEIHYTFKMEGLPPKEVVVKVEPGKLVLASGRFDEKPRPRRGEPWENSLGMKFVPVGDVLVSIWVTRKRDYEVFSENTGRPALAIDFARNENHPAVRVDWHDANAFCEWLTKHEITAGKLDEGQQYRLPTDTEWSRSVGMADEGGTTPQQRDNVNRDLPWEGRVWPPPPRSGNFADTDYRRAPGAKRNEFIADYTDGYPRTSPVGEFPPNKLGLYDMAGNVWQWINDSYNGGTQKKDWGVLRGGSWLTSKREELRLGYRNVVSREERDVQFGFRVVLVPEK